MSASLPSIYDKIAKSAIGFGDMLDHFERYIPNTYPPYNLRQVDERTYKIEIATAGFSRDELSIVHNEDTLDLVISGKKSEPEGKSSFIYKGISERSFSSKFKLAKGIEVIDASYVDGLLVVTLAKPEISNLSKVIAIK